jgi:hypothetical protein
MSARHIPVRPDLDQLKNQAKDLSRAIKRGDASAIEEFRSHPPVNRDPLKAKLADAQLALAQSYGIRSWPRLVQACKVVDAIWRDDANELRSLIRKHPYLLHEMARGTDHCNWGPPLSYAANLGRDRIIEMLRELGAQDIVRAMGRAVLQGQIETARRLYAMGARPPRGAVMGPAESQNGEGMAYALELGAEICDDSGDRLAPVAMVLETYCRNAAGKHRCLELFASRGIELPDTPAMALHRGRIDLLEEHLRRNPELLHRTFSLREIYPRSVGCHEDVSLGLHATPLEGTTLLHMSIDFDEFEISKWLIERGTDVNAKADMDAGGFGGHTPLFGCVVRQVSHRGTAPFAALLLDRGADPNVRASLQKKLIGASDETLHTYRDVTPLEWGRQFHDRSFVDNAATKLIAACGGR